MVCDGGGGVGLGACRSDAGVDGRRRRRRRDVGDAAADGNGRRAGGYDAAGIRPSGNAATGR